MSQEKINSNILGSAINPYKDIVNVGDKLGIRWSANHAKYSAVVQVIKVAGKTVTVEIVDKEVRGYPVGQILKMNIYKPTKDNCLFKLDGKSANSTVEGIDNFNNHESMIDKLANKVINQYWKERISKVEEQHKKEGVYKTGETWLINENGFNKVKDNYEVSV
jgi:hypothetical protein